MHSRTVFKCFLYLFLIIFLLIMIVGYRVLSDDYYSEDWDAMPYEDTKDRHENPSDALKEKITAPIILWWTPFTGDPGSYKTCGRVKCYYTVDRHYRHHEQTQVIMFYGTDFAIQDLPLPRKPTEQWGLLHEESPKNNYLLSHGPAISLFNHTCTFRSESDYPISTHSLENIKWLESKEYMISIEEKNKNLEELAPLFYAHSDCNPPSDRDSYMTMLMEDVPIDSYGSCEHNKDLPEHLTDPIAGMDHSDFYKIQAKYKFSLVMENGVCKDYVTEKLWRALMVGSVPIVFGAPNIRDYLPDNYSAIVIEDFRNVKELAAYIKFLNDNDDEYIKYLEWKKKGVTNQYLREIMKNREWGVKETWRTGELDFITGFECFVCRRVHENIRRRDAGEEQLKYQANVEHYGCPEPLKFDNMGNRVHSKFWSVEWRQKKHHAKALEYFVQNNLAYKKDLFAQTVSNLYSKGDD